MKTFIFLIVFFSYASILTAQDHNSTQQPSQVMTEENKPLYDDIEAVIKEARQSFNEGENYLKKRFDILAKLSFEKAKRISERAKVEEKDKSRLEDFKKELANLISKAEDEKDSVQPTKPAFDDINTVIKEARQSFSEGEDSIKQGFRSLARLSFDKAMKIVQNAKVKDENRPKLEEFMEELSALIYKAETKESSIPPKSKAETTDENAGFLNKTLMGENDPSIQAENKAQKKLGQKPTQSKEGKVQVVMDYFNEYMNDPYSMRFVRWSKVEMQALNGEYYWTVRVRFRAKNAFGAYVLSEVIYLIQRNKVVNTLKIF